MGPSPAAFVRAFDPGRDGAAFDAFVHRWTRGADLVALLWCSGRCSSARGSIEGFFAEGDDPARRRRRRGPRVVLAARAGAGPDARLRPRPPARPASPTSSRGRRSGSACKRLNLFLRWMVRRDAVDLGVWTRVAPARLVVPLDTHIIRLGQCLRLTRYRSPGWRMAADITAALRALDPSDPVRFDFSLCHVGMMGNCGFADEAARLAVPAARRVLAAPLTSTGRENPPRSRGEDGDSEPVRRARRGMASPSVTGTGHCIDAGSTLDGLRGSVASCFASPARQLRGGIRPYAASVASTICSTLNCSWRARGRLRPCAGAAARPSAAARSPGPAQRDRAAARAARSRRRRRPRGCRPHACRCTPSRRPSRRAATCPALRSPSSSRTGRSP